MLDVDIEMMSSFRIFRFWQAKLNEDRIEKLKAEVLLLINFIIFKGVLFLSFFFYNWPVLFLSFLVNFVHFTLLDCSRERGLER